MNNEILEALQAMIGNLIGTELIIGALPPLGGYALSFVGGAPSATFRELDRTVPLPVIFNGKGVSQEEIAANMNAVHDALTTSKTLPYTDTWQMYAIETTSYPNMIGREENGMYIYGSSFSIKYYAKGAN